MNNNDLSWSIQVQLTILEMYFFVIFSLKLDTYFKPGKGIGQTKFLDAEFNPSVVKNPPTIFLEGH